MAEGAAILWNKINVKRRSIRVEEIAGTEATTWCPQEFQIKISGHFQDISGQKFCFSRTISSSGKPKYEHVFRNTL